MNISFNMQFNISLLYQALKTVLYIVLRINKDKKHERQKICF